MWTNRLHEAGAWVRHMWSSKGPHGVHSPFVYDLITKVLRDKKRSALYAAIERERARLNASTDEIEVEDFGAGSRTNAGSVRRVSSIAHAALQPASHARALSLIAVHSRAVNILELGTSFGITTAHLAASLPHATLYTIEGSEAVAKKAQEVWRNVGLTNIQITVGNFDAELGPVLKRMQQVDFVIIDGNHTGEACLRYIESLQPFSHEHTAVVIDDIYWSPSMTAAWQRCIADSRFSLSLDFFDFGLLYRTEGRVKEHFVLKRPWLW